MARNEEKQLARLNRFYLEKQKQEELKKRPPRPRLDTLNTSRELRKWIPTITRDIDFYVKQMEVPCYTDGKIQEFSDQIQRLKQEYRAYLRKLRALEPDISAASWADRPYANRKRHAEEAQSSGEHPKGKSSPSSSTVQNFVPISTPVLQHMPSIVNQYGFEKPAPVVWNVNPETEDQPLQFSPPKTLAICHGADTDDKTCHVSELSSKSVYHRCDRAADSGVNLCERPPDDAVGFSTTSSVGEEQPPTSDVTGHRTKDDRLESESGEMVTTSSKHTVNVPVSISNTFAKKVQGGSLSAVVDRSDATVMSSKSNCLNLDYSDSSDENL